MIGLLLVAACTAPPPPTTLVLVTLDTFRGDHVGDSTPFLREMAAEGLELVDLDTHSWTYPGVGSVMTGLHPALWGVDSWSFDPEADDMPYSLSPAVPTLAEALDAQGWATAYWSSNPIAADKSDLYRGYASYTEYTEGETTGVAPEAVAWLADHRDGPRFLHLHVNDPHSPYDLTTDACAAEVAAADDGACRWDFIGSNEDSLFANDEVRSGEFTDASPDYAACRAVLTAAYRCEIERQDADLRTVWEELEASGEIEGALSVWSVDHGEALLDPWTNHSFDLRMPVLDGWGLVHWPGHVTPGTNELPVSQDDLVPTIAQLLALDLDMDTSGVPVDDVPVDRVRTSFFSGPLPGTTYWDHVHSAYDAAYHYISDSTGGCWLYDRVADPGELTDLCAKGEVPPENLVQAVAEQIGLTEGYSVEPEPP